MVLMLIKSEEFMDNKTYDVIIIGGGPAGLSAGIYTSRAKHKTLIIDKGHGTSALGVADKISNYPGVKGPIKGQDLLNTMKEQAVHFGSTLTSEKVIGINLAGELKKVYTNGNQYSTKVLILATGSFGRTASIKGEKELTGKGVSYCATCDANFYKDKIVAVIGNNEEAVEELLFLSRFVSTAYLIVQTESLKISDSLFNKLNNDKIKVLYNAKIISINGDEKVQSINIIQDTNEINLKTDGVFVYLTGLKPVSEYLLGQLDLHPEGCIIVNRNLETSVPGVYAAGDLICSNVKQAIVAAGDGVIAAISADKYLRNSDNVKLDWMHE